MSDGISDMNREIELLKKTLEGIIYSYRTNYELQYSDYKENQWTVPENLKPERIEQISSDFSIKNIRLIIER